MTKRMISLSAVTNGSEEYYRLFQDLSELANNLSAVHEYVTMNATWFSDDEGPQGDPDGLYFDEATMFKVRQAIMDAIAKELRVPVDSYQIMDKLAMDIITELQNAGILFRERTKS
jgi:hypothetical protein